MPDKKTVLAILAALGIAGGGTLLIDTTTGEVTPHSPVEVVEQAPAELAKQPPAEPAEQIPVVIDEILAASAQRCEQATKIANGLLRATEVRELTADETAAVSVAESCELSVPDEAVLTVTNPELDPFETLRAEFAAAPKGRPGRDQRIAAVKRCATDAFGAPTKENRLACRAEL